MNHFTYQQQRYIPALDGIRAIAIALVITRHLHERMWGFLSGSVGVTIFFVLSGYLITRLALQEEQTKGRLNIKAFYVRRAFRIFPLYFLVLSAYCVMILAIRVWPPKIAPFVSALPYYVLYFQEIPFWKLALTGQLPFYHSWSLGIEEKFYLLWPLMMLWFGKCQLRYRLLFAIVTCVVFAAQGIAAENIRSYSLEPYAFILLGVCLALSLSNPGFYGLFARRARPLSCLAIIVAATTQFCLMPLTNFRGLSVLFASSVTVLIGHIVTSDSRTRRVLSSPPFVLLGRLSYGIYLIHVLCISALEKVAKPGAGRFVGLIAYVATLLVSAALSYCLHKMVEQPFIRIGRRFAAQQRTLHSVDCAGTNQSPNDLNTLLGTIHINHLHWEP